MLLVEARRHPRPKACAEYASPRIEEELRRLGSPDAEWRADALPLTGMRVIRGADAVDVRYHDGTSARAAWGVERTSFDARAGRARGRQRRAAPRAHALTEVLRTAGAWAGPAFARRRDGGRSAADG